MRRREFITFLGAGGAPAARPFAMRAQKQRGQAIMVRHLATVGLFATLLLPAPALAITAQQKMETCKFGADDQRLAGAERKKFISRCMANEASPAKRAKTQPKKGTSDTTPTR
jgi:hypothetical protein